jgi:DNA processing protein
VAVAQDAGRDELAAYLALAAVPGIGAARLRTLVAAFGSARGACAAPWGALAALPGFTRAAATAVRAVRPHAGRDVLERLARLGATVLLPDDPRFPPLVREIPEPPALLYAWGDVALLGRPAAALVGSRTHTAYGRAAAELLAAGVARAGAVVVSGMARGIDALAHAAALDAGGASVGVLGNGFGVIYPAANRALYERMVASGCLVTELPPGERPHAGAFPRRNRLIAGLAGVTVVIEAAPGSGALITADCALDQGRSVLAVPGPITSPASLGCNKLIQQGAKPALAPGDILEELGLPGAAALAPLGEAGAAGSARPAPRRVPPDLTDLERRLWAALAAEPRHVDALVAAAGSPAGAVLTALTELELRGLVTPEPGMRFRLR